MADKLLYFQYIDIPENSWTIKSLLYWDEVGIIVPQQFIQTPDRYDAFTRDLLETDLVQQVFPFDYIHNVPNFDIGFIQLTQGRYFNLIQKQNSFEVGGVTQIHVQKFGKELMDHLISIKIARQLDWEWYEVETKTANKIMHYLAIVIGKVGGFTPATDQIKYMPLRFKLEQTKTRQKLIENLIPYPADANLTQLRKFKDRFHEELKSFRILLEQVTIEISVIKDMEIAEEKLRLKIDEIKDKKNKIFKDLNQFNFKQITFGTVASIGGAMYGLSQDNHSLALFSFANALYSAFQGYDQNEQLSRDYSYLALIDKKLIK